MVGQGVTLVDFWAPWCGPCRMQGPILEELVATLGDRVTIGKVNVDESTGAAVRYGVRSIPTLLVFHDGQMVDRFVGVQPKGVLLQSLEAHVPAAE